MKIAIDIRTLMDSRYSGVSEYVLNLLKAIFEIDKENKYFLYYNSAHDLSYVMPKFNQENVKVISTRYPNKILNYFLFKIFNRPRIDRMINRDIDIFLMPHINFISLPSRGKSVLTIHDLSFLRYPNFFSFRKNFWHRMINIKKLVKRFDKVIAISANTKRELVELCDIDEDKINVVHSAVSDGYRKLSNESKEKERVKKKLRLPDNFILYLGTIEPRKNIESLIIAYEQFRDYNIVKDINNIKLVIAGGNGWKFKRIYEVARKSKYRKDIIFTGYVDNNDKIALYNLAKVFVFPSFYEGFGFPPLEAMACGVPTICSFAPSLSEVVNDGAILIDPYNPSQIAASLNDLFFDNDLYEDMAIKGMVRARKFDWKRTAQVYLNIFNNLKHIVK